MKNFEINIITGLSGSGKSTAIAAFEDAKFHCVDNMPVILLPHFLELRLEIASGVSGFAFVMDLREKDFISRYPAIFDKLARKGFKLTIYFLEASEEILLQRYSQTRRNHPLSHHKSLIDGIREEKKQLHNLRKIADRIIDTSQYTVHELKSVIFKITQESIKAESMKISLMSFGYRHGIPHNADLVIDIRFLANPYFIPELKALDGKNEWVSDYVLNNDEAQIFL